MAPPQLCAHPPGKACRGRSYCGGSSWPIYRRGIQKVIFLLVESYIQGNLSPAHESLADRVSSMWTYFKRQWLENPNRPRISFNFIDNPELTSSNAAESTNWRLTARVPIFNKIIGFLTVLITVLIGWCLSSQPIPCNNGAEE